MSSTDKTSVAIFYSLGLIFFTLTFGFALSYFQDVILFYMILVIIASSYCVLILGFERYLAQIELKDIKPVDSVTGTFLGLTSLITANFMFSFGYSLIYQSIYGQPPLALFGLGLIPLQVSTFAIISHLGLHVLIIAPTEEIIFREFVPLALFQGLKLKLPQQWAVGFAYSISSISYFAIAHLASTQFNPILMGFVITSAVILAIIRVRFGLLSCVISHIGNNIASVFF